MGLRCGEKAFPITLFQTYKSFLLGLFTLLVKVTTCCMCQEVILIHYISLLNTHSNRDEWGGGTLGVNSCTRLQLCTSLPPQECVCVWCEWVIRNEHDVWVRVYTVCACVCVCAKYWVPSSLPCNPQLLCTADWVPGGRIPKLPPDLLRIPWRSPLDFHHIP